VPEMQKEVVEPWRIILFEVPACAPLRDKR